MSEAASPAKTSAFDRNKECDVCLLTCDHVSCYQAPSVLVSSVCEESKFIFSKLPLKNINHMPDHIPSAIVTAILACKHNEHEIKQYRKRLMDTVVLVGGINKIQTSVPRSFVDVVENCSNMNTFAERIREAVLENQIYDSGTTGNDYTQGIVDGSWQDGDQNTTKEEAGQLERTLSLNIHTKQDFPDKGDFSEDLKSPRLYRTDDIKQGYNTSKSSKSEYGYTTGFSSEDNTYASLFNREKDTFVDPRSLMRSESHTGSYVSEECILPKENYSELENASPNAIMKMFNRGEFKDSVDFRKYIEVNVMKKCFRCRNFHGLVSLLKCDDISIQMNALQNMEKFLYSIEVRLCDTHNLLNGINELLEVIELWVGNQELVLLFLNNLLTTFVILFMASNIRGDLSIKDCIQNACKCTREKLDMVEKLHSTDEILKNACQYLRNSAASFCEFSYSQKASILRMGNWADAMKNDTNRKKIKQDFSKLSEIEQSTVVFGLLNLEILQPGNSTVPLEVLNNCLESAISQNLKRKNNVPLFPLLQLTTKMVNMILENSSFQVARCLGLFNLYLDNAKIHQAVRRFLLKEIGSLLFQTDKRIVNNMFYLLNKNKLHSHYDLRQITVSHVEKSLRPLNIHIDCDSCSTSGNSPIPPHWSKFEGTVDDKTVNVYILLPSKNCIMNGVMTDYREHSQEREILKELEQQRDMLYLLCREGITSLVLPLIGFQVRPLPPFYVTLQSRDSVLLTEYLLLKRSRKDWIPHEKLCTMAADMLSSIIFLHKKGIVHRGLTAACFSINDKGQIYLSNLLTATEGHHTEFIAECVRMPLRWSAPESILYDKFSCRSDVYMCGQLLYELYTHGCHPFTELYGFKLDDVLQLIIFQNLKLRQWPCIPKALHEVILQFTETDPHKRKSLADGLEQLNNFLLKRTSQRAAVKIPRHCHKGDKGYPKPDPSLPKEPQTELPELIRHLKNQNGKIDPIRYYTNLRKTQRKQKTILALSEADITSYDAPRIAKRDSTLMVQESVSQKFYEMSFTELSKSRLQQTLNIVKWPPAIEKNPAIVMYTTCYYGESLSQLSLRRCHGDPDDQQNNAMYCRIVHEIVQFANSLHTSDWIIRDICCQNLHYNPKSQKVFSTRLGRMAYIGSSDVLDDSIIEEVFSDRRNWSPIETLQYGQFSKEGDIYMLGMAIYEFFMGLENNVENPAASSIKCVPFCRVPKKELIEHLLSGEVPQQPMYCPDILYDVMVRCWNRDRTQRPTCAEILEITRSLVVENDVRSISVEEEYENLRIPELPPRNHENQSLSSAASNSFQHMSTHKGPFNIPSLRFNRLFQTKTNDQIKWNPVFDRGDSKRSNVRSSSKNWTLKPKQNEAQETSWSSEDHSLTSDSTLSFANSSCSSLSSSTFSLANSSSSDSEESTYDDCISTTREKLRELSTVYENISNHTEEDDIYIEIVDEERDTKNLDLTLNTTRYPDSSCSDYQDFDDGDTYLTPTNP